MYMRIVAQRTSYVLGGWDDHRVGAGWDVWSGAVAHQDSGIHNEEHSTTMAREVHYYYL